MKALVVLVFAALLIGGAAQVIATELPATASRPVTTAGTAPSAPEAPFTRSLSARTIEVGRAPIAMQAVTAQNVDAVLRRASVSTPAERDAVRAAVAKAAVDPAFVAALGERSLTLRATDFSAALVAVSLLGETRSPAAQAHLLRVTALPLPTAGHVVDGIIVERATLEQLQMKAVQGLAYAGTPAGDKEVLRLAAGHESRDVRSEAIESYLYNHKYSAEARATLAAAIKPADKVYLDRPHLLSTTTAADFNAQLARYLQLHPEAVAPAPVKLTLTPAMIERDRTKDAPPVRVRSMPVNRALLLPIGPPPDRQ